MPLQIRRGTEVQRQAMTVPLAAGELLYVTDDQRLYVGNGTTLGGVQITGYTNEDAVDAIGAALVAGSHSGITFTYGSTQDLAGRIDATVDLSSYNGTISASAFKGSLVADDSTILVDGVSGTVTAPVIGNVTGNLTGNVTGNINGVVTGTAGSSLIGNVTGNLTGNVTGNITGFHTGDMKGSVFGDDSTALVNGPDSSINLDGTVKSSIIPASSAIYNIGSTSYVFNNTYTTNILSSSGASVLNTNTKTATLAQINLESSGLINGSTMIATIPSITFATNSLAPTDPWPNLYTINTASAGTNSLGLSRSRGTLVSPATVNNGDEIGGISINGHDGTGFVTAAEIVWEVNNAVSTNVVPSKMDIKVTNSTGTLATQVSVKATEVEFAAPPKLPIVADDAARTTLVPTAAQGMLIFMQSGTTPAATNKVQVFDGSNWVNLH
jgi:hypothetical protein